MKQQQVIKTIKKMSTLKQHFLSLSIKGISITLLVLVVALNPLKTHEGDFKNIFGI